MNNVLERRTEPLAEMSVMALVPEKVDVSTAKSAPLSNVYTTGLPEKRQLDTVKSPLAEMAVPEAVELRTETELRSTESAVIPAEIPTIVTLVQVRLPLTCMWKLPILMVAPFPCNNDEVGTSTLASRL